VLRLVTKRTLLRPTSVTVYELTEAGRALAPTIRALSAWGQEHGLPTTKAQTLRPAWILLSVARRAPRIAARRWSQLRAPGRRGCLRAHRHRYRNRRDRRGPAVA
jgi:HxlR-like helix-turn-helix